jgi:hypothetical protein
MSLPFPSSSPLASDRRLPEDRQPLPVIGWRSWKLRQAAEGVVLEGLFQSERWEVGVTRARCRRCPPWMTNQHSIPELSCECGLYAFSTPAAAVRHAERQLAAVFAGCGQAQPVAGAVVGWGRVVQHGDQGWRAGYARPVALLNMGQPLLEEAASRYGVPLVSMRGLCLLPLEYGEARTAVAAAGRR